MALPNAELSADPAALHNAIQEIYATLPRMRCKGRCQDACGRVGMSRAEAFVIEHAHGRLPVVGNSPAARCSELRDDGACGIYADRPLICRLWGMVKRLRCPHGCKPVGGWVSDDEAFTLARALDLLYRSDESPADPATLWARMTPEARRTAAELLLKRRNGQR